MENSLLLFRINDSMYRASLTTDYLMRFFVFYIHFSTSKFVRNFPIFSHSRVSARDKRIRKPVIAVWRVSYLFHAWGERILIICKNFIKKNLVVFFLEGGKLAPREVIIRYDISRVFFPMVFFFFFCYQSKLVLFWDYPQLFVKVVMIRRAEVRCDGN